METIKEIYQNLKINSQFFEVMGGKYQDKTEKELREIAGRYDAEAIDGMDRSDERRKEWLKVTKILWFIDDDRRHKKAMKRHTEKTATVSGRTHHKDPFEKVLRILCGVDEFGR